MVFCPLSASRPAGAAHLARADPVDPPRCDFRQTRERGAEGAEPVCLHALRRGKTGAGVCKVHSWHFAGASGLEVGAWRECRSLESSRVAGLKPDPARSDASPAEPHSTLL